ncbi:hypothetical protein [Methylocystis sp.]|uniref:hypothetical protein n=1 Tax=Methylocystis sp. TaxID=1911079 RepID=UPI003D135E70
MRLKYWILTGFIASFFLWGAVESNPTPDTQNNQKDVRNTKDRENRSDGRSPSSAPQKSRHNERHDANNGRYSLWGVAWVGWIRAWVARVINEPPNFFALMVAVFTYFLWDATASLFTETKRLSDAADAQKDDTAKSIAIAKESADAALKSANLAETAMHRLERAYVFVKDFSVNITRKPGQLSAYGFEIPGVIEYYSIQIVLCNSGRSPAIKAVFYSGTFNPTNESATEYKLPEPIEKLTFIIGPGAEISVDVIIISADDADRISIGMTRYFIFGAIDYDDIFEGTNRHRTEYCFEVIFKQSSIAFVPYANFNATDGDCWRKPKPYEDNKPAPGRAEQAPDS